MLDLIYSNLIINPCKAGIVIHVIFRFNPYQVKVY